MTKLDHQETSGNLGIMAEIGLLSPQTAGKDLQEVQPAPCNAPTWDIGCSDGTIVDLKEACAWHRETGQLLEEVARLREIRNPFLEEKAPPLPARPRCELQHFQFRFEEEADLSNPKRNNLKETQWETVCLPDYRGPIGWWAGWYRKELHIPVDILQNPRVFLCFGAVDYRCQVYLNDRLITTHEGFFAPFEVDIRPFIHTDGENILAIRIENESPTLGLKSWAGPDIDGNKIYAATGLGWDEPAVGWTHCPPGAGIWQKVWLEGRSEICLTHLTVLPDCDNGEIQARIELDQPHLENRPFQLKAAIQPRNFEGPSHHFDKITVRPAGPGKNTFYVRLPLPDFRTWTPETPFLYLFRVWAQSSDGQEDCLETSFGMRKFEMDESRETKGTYYLNGNEILLRGANTMGHLQRAAFEGNHDQIVEDILIARVTGLNFLRLTQRPVQPEIYDYCDRLGMMVQTDLPLFGFLRRNQAEEALRQVGEMERLIVNHPSNIVVSYINEPFCAASMEKDHRHLRKEELDLFLEAAVRVNHLHNPQRVIKPVEGDYCPPSPGLPDNHCYCLWYNGHGVPFEKLHCGYWQKIKPGWKFACGEFGVEGLDAMETMQALCPKEWLPEKPDAFWTPEQFICESGGRPCQTWQMHQHWFEEKETLPEWVKASQQHQAWAIKKMTRAFRRLAPRMNSFAVHLLIDAWPAGWMKSLMDVTRKPKPAWFAYRDALAPLLADIRSDRQRFWGGEKACMELWVCNDTHVAPAEAKLQYEIWLEGKRTFAQSTSVEVPVLSAACLAKAMIPLPRVSKRSPVEMRLALLDHSGHILNMTREIFEVFPATPAWDTPPIVHILGERGCRAWRIVETLGCQPMLFNGTGSDTSPLLVESPQALDTCKEAVEQAVSQGARAILLDQPHGSKWDLPGGPVEIPSAKHPRSFLCRNTRHPLLSGFREGDFAHWYEEKLDRLEPVSQSVLDGQGLEPVLYTGERGGKRMLPVVAERHHGKGAYLICQLNLENRLFMEPPAYLFLQAMFSN